MHVGYTYDADDSADSRPGIKLKASEPLSPNAFVQIPVEPPHAQQTAVHVPAARQKKMRVPHGGSVERPVQRTPRRPAPSVSFEEPVAPVTAASPSLHIFLEPDDQDEPQVPDEQPDSLAQFVASFPKIPDKLIFQPSAEEAEDGEDAESADDESGVRGLPEDDFAITDFDDSPLTMRLDEGNELAGEFDLTPDEPYPAAQGHSRMTLQRNAIPPSGRVKPVNPRFEKMIRDATASRMPAQRPMKASADLPSRGSQGGTQSYPQRDPRMRSHGVSGSMGSGLGAGAVGGVAAAAASMPAASGHQLHSNSQRPKADSGSLPQRSQTQSGPLPQRSQAQSGPSSQRLNAQSGSLPSRTPGSAVNPSANVSKDGARSSRNSANIPAPAVGVSPGRVAVGPTSASRATSRPLSQSADSPVTRPLGSVSQPSMPSGSTAEPSASYLGKPLLDPHAIEESTIFDEPPVSIAEGMKDADKSHKKGRKFAIIGAAVVVVAAIGAFLVLGNQGSIVIPEITITTTDSNAKGSSDSENAGGSSTEEAVGGGEATATGAGSVTYKYTAKTPGGIEYTVEESTTFNAAGECTFTTMKMQFPKESAAKDYTDSLARDLGSKYTLDSLDGANATITIDNSSLGLNREDYENALRYSVDDLVILKK